MTGEQFLNSWVFDQLWDLTCEEVFNDHRMTMNFVLGDQLEVAKVELRMDNVWAWRNRFDETLGDQKAGDRQVHVTLCNN